MSSQPEVASTSWLMRGRGKSSLGDTLLRSVKSTHMRHLPVLFWTRMGLASHSECLTSRMTPAFSSLAISFLASSSHSNDMQRSFCFLGGRFAFEGQAVLNGLLGYPRDVLGSTCKDARVTAEY